MGISVVMDEAIKEIDHENKENQDFKNNEISKAINDI